MRDTVRSTANQGRQHGATDSVQAALTEPQLEGFACVVCGSTFTVGVGSKPVAHGPRGQLFACAEPCFETWERSR